MESQASVYGSSALSFKPVNLLRRKRRPGATADPMKSRTMLRQRGTFDLPPRPRASIVVKSTAETGSESLDSLGDP